MSIQGSPVIRKIEFREDLPLGLLIGSKGKNLKEISEATGTKVHVEAKRIPYHFLIKAYPGSSTSIEERLNESERQVRALIERITERREREMKFNEIVEMVMNKFREDPENFLNIKNK
jgi:hypothetical protein